MSSKICYFCDIKTNFESKVYETPTSIIFRDNFPITHLHTLIVPKEHIANIFDLSESQYIHLFDLVKEESKKLLKLDPSIKGFNIGVNQGEVSGQTVNHVHIHLIPRREGDVLDPRGGVRWIIPEKAKYWID